MHTQIGRCLIALTLIFSGCSFGGFSGGENGASSSESAPEKQIPITGAISYGPLKTGNIAIYPLNYDGKKGDLLGESSTDENGNYEVTIPYTGAVLVEGSGIYYDPASGQALPLEKEKPLRAAALVEADTSNVIVVTPLTELAFQKALSSGIISSSNINSANSLVSEIFKSDILKVKPALPQDFAKPETTQVQRDYYLAIAAMAEMALAKGGLEAAITLLTNDLYDGEMTKESSVILRDSLQAFLSSAQNTTGITDVYRSNLLNMGGKVQKVKVATNQSLTGTAIRGVETSIALPLEYTVKTDYSSGKVIDGTVTTSGSINPDGIKYTPPSASTPAVITISMTFNESGSGEVVVISCDLPAGGNIDINSIVLPQIEGGVNPRFYDETGATVVIPDLTLVFSAG